MGRGRGSVTARGTCYTVCEYRHPHPQTEEREHSTQGGTPAAAPRAVRWVPGPSRPGVPAQREQPRLPPLCTGGRCSAHQSRFLFGRPVGEVPSETYLRCALGRGPTGAHLGPRSQERSHQLRARAPARGGPSSLLYVREGTAERAAGFGGTLRPVAARLKMGLCPSKPTKLKVF